MMNVTPFYVTILRTFIAIKKIIQFRFWEWQCTNHTLWAYKSIRKDSSPGLDEFTYVIIKFLWPLIGHPITKGFEVMVEKEELYPNLRSFRKHLPIDSNTSDSQKAYSKTKSHTWSSNEYLQFIKKGKLENRRLALLAMDFK